MYSADDVKKMLNGDNTGTSSAGYTPVTTKDIKKMLAGYDFTNKQSVLRDKSNKPMPVNTGYKKALPAVQGVEAVPPGQQDFGGVQSLSAVQGVEAVPPGQQDFGGVQSLSAVKDKTTNFAPSVSRKDYVREYQRIHGGSEKAANMAYNLNKAKSFKTTELASGRDVVTSPAYRQTNGKSLLSRAADTVSGGLKGSAAGNTNALATIYQAGQTGRTVQNNKFLADKRASLETARRDLALMLEDNAAGTGGWSAGDIKTQRDMIAALQSEADAMRFVVDGNVQQNAAVTAQNEADAIQQSAGRDIESAKEGLGWLGSHVVDAGAAMTQVVGDMAAGVALGGIGGSAPFVARSFGGGAQGARQDGADLEGQLLYGGAEAAKEYLTEKMFGLALPFSKAYGSGSMDDVVKKGIQKAVDKFAKTEAGKQWLGRGLNFAAASLSEGAEELIGNFIGWQMPKLYGGEPERFSDMLANAFSEAVTGAMTGAIGAAVTPGSYHYDGGENDVQGVGNAPQNAVQTDGNAQAETMPIAQQNAAQAKNEPLGLPETATSPTLYADEKGNVANSLPADTGRFPMQEYSPVNAKQVFANPAVDAIEKIHYPDSEPIITKSNRATVASGKANGVSNAQIKRVGSIASAIKVDVVFDAEAGINGKYENGVIHINPNSKTPVLDTFFHELTHHIENADGYRYLQDRILESDVFLSSVAENGMSLTQYRQSIIDNYARQGVTLDEAGANAEMTAEFVKEHLFKDQKAIDRLCETDVSLGRRILNWIEDLVVKLKGKPEQAALLEMQKMYKKALAGVKVGENTAYSIYTDSKGKPDIRRSLSNEKDPFIPKGEKPTRDVDVKKKSHDKYVSRYARTLAEAGVTDDSTVDLIQKMVEDGTLTHETINDKRAISYAEQQFKDGYSEAVDTWDKLIKSGVAMGKEQLALGQMIYNQAVQNKDVPRVKKMIADLTVQFSETGRNLQAARLLKKMTPDGRLYALEQAAAKVNKDLKVKFGDKAPTVAISEENARKMLESKNQKEMDEAATDIQQEIADQMPPTWEDKLNAWRYLSMLGNPRTHIRNIMGNAMFVPVRYVKNTIAAAIEAADMEAGKINQENRTKSITKSKRAVEFAKNDFEKYKDVIRGENKYDVKSGVQEKQTVYQTKWLEKLRKANFNALEAEDVFFLRSAYIDAMARAITARHINAASLYDGSAKSNAQLESIRSYAMLEAQKATYRDANALAEWITKQKRRLSNGAMTNETAASRAASRAGAIAVEGLLPFTKTPANILKRAVEYSPAGLIKAVTLDARSVRKGEISATQYIDNLASGLTGTGLVALGFWLAKLGLIHGAGDDKDKKRQFDELRGIQEYSLDLGDKTYTIDWAAPAIMPVMVGVEAVEAVEQGKVILDTALDALSKMSEPMFKMSMLQSVNSAIKAAAYDTTTAATSMAKNMVESYPGQFVPTLFGQIARTVDDTRRTTYVDKNSAVPKGLQRFARKQQAKIPQASKALNPRLDQFGREQVTGSVAQRAFQNFLSPGYIAEKRMGTVETELEKLYAQNKNADVLPGFAEKSVTVKEETKQLSAGEYDTYAKIRGQTAYKNLEGLFNDSDYEKLSTEEKESVVKDIYNYSNAVAKTKVSAYELDGTPAKAKAAEDVGIEAYRYYLIKSRMDTDGNDSVTQEEAKKALDASGLSTSQKAYLFALQNKAWKDNPYK